jgi:glycosyltransferase involved in cell wall biosynthesis
MARILHIDRQRHWTGQQARTYKTVQYLAARGHEVMIVCHPGAEYARRGERDGLRVVPIPMRLRSTIAAVPRLARLLRRERIDLVDAHGGIDHQIAALAAKLGGRPVVVRTKHKNVALHSGIWSRLFYRPPLTHKVVAISDAVRVQLIEDGLPAEHVELIYTATDVDRFRPGRDPMPFRERLGIAKDLFVVGSASRLHHSKGVDVLIRAVGRVQRRHPHVRHLHVGHGNPGRFHEVVRAEGIPTGVVMLPGATQDMEGFYAAIDTFCLSSRTEGLGTVILEAMASGLPVIASRTGGIPEAVDDGRTGLLLPPEDVDALAAAIERLVLDPALRARLGAEARRRAEERFSVKTMLARTEELYLSLLEKHGRAPVPAKAVPAEARDA